MSKPFTNPFFEADMSKMLDVSKMLDMSKMVDLSKMTGDYRLPQFDVDALTKLQKKNVEAFTAVGQAVYESFQSLCRRQADLYRQGMEEATKTWGSILSSPTPEDKVIKQAEAGKLAMEKSIANLSDIAETISKCNAQAMETVSTRMNEGLNELRDIIKSNRAA